MTNLVKNSKDCNVSYKFGKHDINFSYSNGALKAISVTERYDPRNWGLYAGRSSLDFKSVKELNGLLDGLTKALKKENL